MIVDEDDEADMKPRPPIVTVMGRRPGKASLLGALRSSELRRSAPPPPPPSPAPAPHPHPHPRRPPPPTLTLTTDRAPRPHPRLTLTLHPEDLRRGGRGWGHHAEHWGLQAHHARRLHDDADTPARRFLTHARAGGEHHRRDHPRRRRRRRRQETDRRLDQDGQGLRGAPSL